MKLALRSCVGLLLGSLAWGSSWAGIKGEGSPARLGQTPSNPKPGPASPIPGIGFLAAPVNSPGGRTAPLPLESSPSALPPTAPKPGESSPAPSPTGPAAPAESLSRPAPIPAPGGGGGNEQPPRPPAPYEQDTGVFEKKLADSLRDLGVPAGKAAELARKVGASVDKSRYDLVSLVAVILRRMSYDRLGPDAAGRLKLLLSAAWREPQGGLAHSAQGLLPELAQALGKNPDSLSKEISSQALESLLSQLRQDPLIPPGLGQLLARLIIEEAPWQTAEKAAEAPLNLQAPERGPPEREQAASPAGLNTSGLPTSHQSPSLVKITQDILQSLGAESRSGNTPIANDPSAFRRLAARVLSRLPDRTRPFNPSSAAAKILAAQQACVAQFLAMARPLIKGKGIGPKGLVLHGTTLRGLIGMLFSGRIEPTSTYFGGRTGASGESLDVWVTRDLESGAGYAASKSVLKNLPGALILLHNPKEPLQLAGESLKSPASVKDDFLAVIVTDGERSFVLEKHALAALAASAQLWKNIAVALFLQGQGAEFKVWESFQQALDPHNKSF